MPSAAVAGLTTPDERLVELARAGDPPAREELFRRHFNVSYRVARRLLGHDQDALDAVQDGYLKAVRHLEEFDGRSGFRTWLLRIITNAAIDIGRRRRRRPTIALDDSANQMIDHRASPGPSLGLERADLHRHVHDALDRLNPKIRATVVLCYEAGLSYKEIAEVQEVPIGTVMSRLNFAKQKLQLYLADIEL